MMRKIIAKQKLKEYINRLYKFIREDVISVEFSLSILEKKENIDGK